MAGLWSRKFDHKNGEDRVCKQCGETFHAVKPTNKCRLCINKAQRVIETVKRAKYPLKKPYPFNTKTNEAGARFHRIQRELRQAWQEYDKTGDKSLVVAHYEKQLNEIAENGILTWIYDRRCDAAKKENKPKTANMTRKDYPDTRGHYEE